MTRRFSQVIVIFLLATAIFSLGASAPIDDFNNDKHIQPMVYTCYYGCIHYFDGSIKHNYPRCKGDCPR